MYREALVNRLIPREAGDAYRLLRRLASLTVFNPPQSQQILDTAFHSAD